MAHALGGHVFQHIQKRHNDLLALLLCELTLALEQLRQGLVGAVLHDQVDSGTFLIYVQLLGGDDVRVVQLLLDLEGFFHD